MVGSEEYKMNIYERIKNMNIDAMTKFLSKNAAKILVLSKSSEFVDEVQSSSYILVREWLESEA